MTIQPVRALILLLIGVVLGLSMAEIGYLTWSNDKIEDGEHIINDYHLASAIHATRMMEEIMRLRAHHAEEHLDNIQGEIHRKLSPISGNHLAVLTEQFSRLNALNQTFLQVSPSPPNIKQTMASLGQRLEELQQLWPASQNNPSKEVDPFFEPAFDHFAQMEREITALNEFHRQQASTLNERLKREKAFFDAILHAISIILAVVGLLVSRRILQLITDQMENRLATERALSQRSAEVAQAHLTLDALRRSNRSMIMALADLAENRDSNTGEHVLRVARMTHEIAQELRQNNTPGIDATFLEQVALASMLHDVGKVTTPDHILLKPGPLTPEERTIMQRHAQAGAEFLFKVRDLQQGDSYIDMAIRIARHHHEQHQGNGYPDDLAGDQIPLEARIVAVADVYDALTSWRPYKAPWSQEEARKFVQEKSGIMFDPQVVQALEKVLEHRRATHVLAWSDDMTVGQPALDNDHRILIALINQIARARANLDPAMLELVIDELFNYTIRHFHREEIFMEQCGFPALTDHKNKHDQFSAKVMELRRGYLQGHSLDYAQTLENIMGEWLKSHILVEDRAYFHWSADAQHPSRLEA